MTLSQINRKGDCLRPMTKQSMKGIKDFKKFQYENKECALGLGMTVLYLSSFAHIVFFLSRSYTVILGYLRQWKEHEIPKAHSTGENLIPIT